MQREKPDGRSVRERVRWRSQKHIPAKRVRVATTEKATAIAKALTGWSVKVFQDNGDFIKTDVKG